MRRIYTWDTFRRLAVLGGATAVLLTLAVPAQADDAAADGVIHGIEPLPDGYDTLAETPEIQAAKPSTDAMLKVYELWAQQRELLQEGASSSELAELDTRIAVAETRAERLLGAPIGRREDMSKASAVAAAAPYAAVTLPLKHSKQSNGYYCGPATTAMVIRMSGGGEVSNYNSGHKMSQTTLASSTYLATTTNGTNINRIKVTLQRWAGLSTSVYAGPTATKLKDVVTGAMGNKRQGVAYGTHETLGGAHYNNHPNKTIDHFIAGYGYRENGVYLKYADPVSGYWTGPAKTGEMRAYQMRDFIAPWGVVA